MSKQPMQRFDEDWQQWLDRPTELSPQMAAQRVKGRLKESPHPRWQMTWRPLLAVAALFALVIVGIWGPAQRPAPVEPAAPLIDLLAAAAPSTDVLVIQLDSETPLYLTLASDRKRTLPESNPGDLL